MVSVKGGDVLIRALIRSYIQMADVSAPHHYCFLQKNKSTHRKADVDGAQTRPHT